MQTKLYHARVKYRMVWNGMEFQVELYVFQRYSYFSPNKKRINENFYNLKQYSYFIQFVTENKTIKLVNLFINIMKFMYKNNARGTIQTVLTGRARKNVL